MTEGSGEITTAIQDYVARVESFVQIMHDGLSALETGLENSRVEPSTSLEPAAREIGPRVLLVIDPAEINRVLFGRYFQSYPFKIYFAKSRDGVESKIANEQIDIVIDNWSEILALGLPKAQTIQRVLEKLA